MANNQYQKILAGEYVRRQVYRGKLLKPKICSKCASSKLVEAHHHKGYARENWLDIVWLCRNCHARTHKLLRAAISK